MSSEQRTIALSRFLDALDEWGCEDNAERAESIIQFIDGGYDLSTYHDNPRFRVIAGGHNEQ